ncbi:MAG: UDP-3-O-[3-hydroxymyristoyl] glucosamine N-acyltransferase [Oleiphilaceae bacterium]|jgi:UDP-3-O-[3-hydroxymyristoyl] glucosamine N-acyltransferase
MPFRAYTLSEVAEIIGAEVHGDAEVQIVGLATLQNAKSDQLSFLANPAYEKYLPETKAAAVIVNGKFLDKCPKSALIHENPYMAYAKLSHLWDKNTSKDKKTFAVHPSAVIHHTAKISAQVQIQAGVVVGECVSIGSGAIIGANTVIGDDCVIGENSCLSANVSVYYGVSIGKNCIIHSGVVLGSDGFGFAPINGEWLKICQLGGVIIEDNVEIGANTTVDRGALDNTVIEKGVILDNQIQVAHNVRIGQNTAIAACTAIAGSTVIGKNCIIGGASGIAGHLTIADGVHLTAMTMVIKSLTEPGVYSSGTGVQTNAKWRKSIARLRQLDKMADRIKQLEQTLKARDVE